MYIIIFVLGLVIGSFLNVCIFRIPLKQSIAFPPSHCFNCDHDLGVLDLFPVFSYLFLGGKCKYCGEKISIQYPIIEFVNGIIYLYIFSRFGVSYHFVFYSLLISLLLVIAVIDYKTETIPNALIIFGFISGLAYRLTEFYMNKSITTIRDGILGFFIGGGVILIVILVSRGGMGAGDMKLMGVIGLFLGFKSVLLTLFLGVILGGILGVALIALKIKDRKAAIPFGPFLALGTFITLFGGDYILNWYLSLL